MDRMVSNDKGARSIYRVRQCAKKTVAEKPSESAPDHR